MIEKAAIRRYGMESDTTTMSNVVQLTIKKQMAQRTTEFEPGIK
jgi:hypothetical protein